MRKKNSIFTPFSKEFCRTVVISLTEGQQMSNTEIVWGKGANWVLWQRTAPHIVYIDVDTNIAADNIKTAWIMTTGMLFMFLPQFQWFQIEVLQAMEKNVKLDEEYIEVSLRKGKFSSYCPKLWINVLFLQPQKGKQDANIFYNQSWQLVDLRKTIVEDRSYYCSDASTSLSSSSFYWKSVPASSTTVWITPVLELVIVWYGRLVYIKVFKKGGQRGTKKDPPHTKWGKGVKLNIALFTCCNVVQMKRW